MSTANKIKDLCDFNNIPISKLESTLGFSNGSLTKNNANAMRSDRIQAIAKFFNVTPTFLMTDMKYCVCPVCGAAYIPTNEADLESHNALHENYLSLRDKIGYLLNPSQAATKRAVAQSYLEQGNLPDEGKLFHYETLVQCDFAENAFLKNFQIDIEYPDFIKSELRAKKYFELLSPQIIKNLSAKYNVDLSENDAPLIDLFQSDKEFMSNITDLWDLPQSLRYDVYKAIRHAKRDYADKEYYTNPYANVSKHCHDNYDPDSEKCQNCRKE